MPRRDVVLTALIAFGAGVAVGANWKELRKKIGPLLEKLGLKIADLGDLLSASNLEEFGVAARSVKRSRRRKARGSSKNGADGHAANSRNGSHAGPVGAKKQRAARRRSVAASAPDSPGRVASAQKSALQPAG